MLEAAVDGHGDHRERAQPAPRDLSVTLRPEPRVLGRRVELHVYDVPDRADGTLRGDADELHGSGLRPAESRPCWLAVQVLRWEIE